MKNKTGIVIIMVTLVVLGTAFYWYEWRPAQIRKECASNPTGNRFDILDKNQYEAAYKTCIRLRGLER